MTGIVRLICLVSVVYFSNGFISIADATPTNGPCKTQSTVYKSKSKEKLEGLHPENAKKMTDTPTCERILKAFSNITLTIFKIGSDVQMHISPLSQTQLNILDHLGLDPSVYNGLTENLEI